MAPRARSRLPWTLVAASVLLVAVVLYLLFAAYLPARQRIDALERDLRDVAAREGQLRTRVQREQQYWAGREQQAAAERETLSKRVEELETELAAIKKGRRR